MLCREGKIAYILKAVREKRLWVMPIKPLPGILSELFHRINRLQENIKEQMGR